MYVFDTNREMIWSILACFLVAVKRIKPFFTADHTQYALRATLLRKSYLVFPALAGFQRDSPVVENSHVIDR